MTGSDELPADGTMDLHTAAPSTDTCKVIPSDRLTHLHVRPRRILKTRITIHLNLNQEDAGFPSGASSNPTKRSPSPHPHSTSRITKVHWTRTRSTIPDRVPSLPLKTPTSPSTTMNPHLHRNCLRETEAPPAERGDTITTPLHRCKVEYLREAAATPIVHTDLPPIATETETETRTGIGTGTVIAIGGRIHPVAADDTTNTTRTTIVDIPLPHVATLGAQKDTDLVAIVKAPANENALRDTEMTTTATDLPPIDIDHPARSTTATTTMKIRKNVGDADARGGNAKRIGKSTMIYRRNRRVSMTRPRCTKGVTTEVMSEVTSRTLQVSTIANTDPGMITTHYPFQIIS